MSQEREIAYESRFFKIPKKGMGGTAPDPDKLTQQLNELGREGWYVVATFSGAPVSTTNSLLLQRERR